MIKYIVIAIVVIILIIIKILIDKFIKPMKELSKKVEMSQEELNEATRQKNQMETILLHMTDGLIAFNIEEPNDILSCPFWLVSAIILFVIDSIKCSLLGKKSLKLSEAVL